MTVGYMRMAATANARTFLRLLLRWRGSVWKSVWKELVIWLILYNFISVINRIFLFGTTHATTFNKLVEFADESCTLARTSLTFVLGFYVSQIAKRWWDVFMVIPWPDSIGLSIAAFLNPFSGDATGVDEDRTLRMTIMRYLVLSYVLVFRDVSEKIRKRFPTLLHLVPALITKKEFDFLEAKIQARKTLGLMQSTGRTEHYVPIEWILQHLKKCAARKQIADVHYVFLCEQIVDYRDKLNKILCSDWVNVPLVYSQAVNLAAMVYFLMCLIGRQYIADDGYEKIKYRVDYVFPLFTVFELIFFIGWLKTAQVMINPFGMDDDDFEIDALIERNLAMGMSMVDDFYDAAPPLCELEVTELPHTLASARQWVRHAHPMVGSATLMRMRKRDMAPIDARQAKWLADGNKLATPFTNNDVDDADYEENPFFENPRRIQISSTLDQKTVVSDPLKPPQTQPQPQTEGTKEREQQPSTAPSKSVSNMMIKRESVKNTQVTTQVKESAEKEKVASPKYRPREAIIPTVVAGTKSANYSSRIALKTPTPSMREPKAANKTDTPPSLTNTVLPSRTPPTHNAPKHETDRILNKALEKLVPDYDDVDDTQVSGTPPTTKLKKEKSRPSESRHSSYRP